MSSNDPRHWALVKRASQVAELNKLALSLGMNDNTYRDTLIGAGLGGAAGIGANVFANPKDEDDEDDEGRSMWGDVGAGMLGGGLIGAGVNQYTGGDYGGSPPAPTGELSENWTNRPDGKGVRLPSDSISDLYVGGEDDVFGEPDIGPDGGLVRGELMPKEEPSIQGKVQVGTKRKAERKQEADDAYNQMMQDAQDAVTDQGMADAVSRDQEADAAFSQMMQETQDLVTDQGMAQALKPRNRGDGVIEKPVLAANGTISGEWEDTGMRIDPRDGKSIIPKHEFDRLRDAKIDAAVAGEYNEDDRLQEHEDAVDAQQRITGGNYTAENPAPAIGQGIGVAQQDLPLGETDVVSGQTGGPVQGGVANPIGAPGSDPATQPVDPLALPEAQGGHSRLIKELHGAMEKYPNDQRIVEQLTNIPSIKKLSDQIHSLRAMIDQQGAGGVGDLPDRLKRAEAMWNRATNGRIDVYTGQAIPRELATKEGAVARMARTSWSPEASHEEAHHKALEFGALMAKRAMGYKESGSYAKKKKKEGNRRKVLIGPEGKAQHRPYEDDDAEEKKAHLQGIISQGTARFLGREEKQAKRNEGPGQGYAPAPQGGRGMMLTRGMERKLNNPNKSIDTARVSKRLHKGKNKMAPTPRRLREDMPVGQGSTPNPFK